MLSSSVMRLSVAALVGLGGGTFAGWSYGNHVSAEQAARAARENILKVSGNRMQTGDLAQVLRSEAARRKEEVAMAAAYLDGETKRLREQVSEGARGAEQMKTLVTSLGDELKQIRDKKTALMSSGGQAPESEVAAAREELGLMNEPAKWAGWNQAIDELASKLGSPMKQGDHAALKERLGSLPSAASLPDAAKWKAGTTEELDRWISQRFSP